MESRLLRLIEPKAQLDSRRKVFSNASLMQMIVPLFFEQLLTMMVGIADTFMISYAGAALSRSCGRTDLTMKVSIAANIINVTGNAIGIFLLHAGVAGVACPTLIARIFPPWS